MRKNTYRLAKTSWSHQASEFFEKSTLHGVRYITEPNRPAIESVLWFSCISVGLTVAIIIIFSLWEKFQVNPTLTGLDTDFHNWDVEFPSVSLCFTSPVDPQRVRDLVNSSEYEAYDNKEELENFLTDLGKLEVAKIKTLAEYAKNTLSLPQEGLKSLAKKVLYRCNDLISECVFKGDNFTCCDMFFPYFTESGFCLGFNVNPSQGLFMENGTHVPPFEQQYIYESDPKWSLEVTMQRAFTHNEAVLIFLHMANEKPGIDNVPRRSFMGNVSRLAFSSKTTYTTDDTYQLSINQRKCVFPYEIKLSNSEKYTYGACMRQCRIRIALELCGCIPYFYHWATEANSCPLDKYICLQNHLEKIFSVVPCDCALSCEITVYEMEKLIEWTPEVGNRGRIEFGFVSWPTLRYKREVLFGWVDLLVSFGGIAGLFLGFSLLSCVEIIYYFTMRACCMVIRDKEQLEILYKEEQLREKPPLDLRLTPIWMRKDEPDHATINVKQKY